MRLNQAIHLTTLAGLALKLLVLIRKIVENFIIFQQYPKEFLDSRFFIAHDGTGRRNMETEALFHRCKI